MMQNAFNAAALAACVGVLTYAIADENFIGGLFYAAVLIWLWRFRLSHDQAIMPKSAINALLLAAVAYLVLRLASVGGMPEQTVSVITSFIPWLVIIKLLEKKSPRNNAQLIALSVMLGIGSSLIGVSLWMGFSMIVLLLLSTHAVLIHQIWAAESRATQAGAVGAKADRPGMQRSMRSVLISSMLLMTIGASLVFMAMPRGLGGSPIESFASSAGRFQSGSGVSGFADSIQLGGVSSIQNSPVVVMEADIVDRGRPPAPNASYLLRGAILDQYDTEFNTWQRFETQDGEKGTGRVVRTNFVDRIRRPEEDGILQRITLRRGAIGSNHLFALYMPTDVALQTGDVASQGKQMRYSRDTETGELTYANSEHAIIRYEVYSRREVFDTTTAEASTPQQRRTFVDTPIGDLARQIIADANYERVFEERFTERDQAIARVLQLWLRQNCAYTLERSGLPDEDTDPIEHFLFEERQGHCEYFAAGLASMLRSLGIHARVVTGYVAVERNPGSNGFLIRQAHAHAWVELEAEPGRYVTFDPSPPGEIESLHYPRGIIATLRRWRDQIESLWVNNVVAYDADRQNDLLSILAGREISVVDIDIAIWSRFRRTDLARLGLMGLFGAGTILMMSGLFQLIRRSGQKKKLHANHRSVFAGDANERLLNKQAEFYARSLRALERAGIAKPEWMGAQAHADAITNKHSHEIGDDISMIAKLYYHLRFGRSPLSEEQLAEALSCIHRIEQYAKNRPSIREDR
ncbi:MAG: DUF3488 and transglutaminase-like domain-containing protein [Planctomycetota bacterium]